MQLKTVFLVQVLVFFISFNCFASEKQPEFAGTFYSADKKLLTSTIDGYLEKANPVFAFNDILAIISPHAGYGYSGPTAAEAYKLIKNRTYKTVIILGTAHRYAFNGFAVADQDYFSTPLGKIPVDKVFAASLVGQDEDVVFENKAFKGEHSVEVQLPFLQRTLSNFSSENVSASCGKIVPIVCGDVTFDACQRFAHLLKSIIGDRKDVLIVVSTDMYHGYNLKELEKTDQFTLDYFEKLDSEGLYYGLRDEKLQLCGGFGVVSAFILAKESGYNQLKVLKHTNSALDKDAGNERNWVVGYASCAINRPEAKMKLTDLQKKRLLEIARNAIETYLKTGKKLDLTEVDPVFLQERGVFVTLNQNNRLRGCIGNLTSSQELYLTIRDMAVESAVDDPRFAPLKLAELKEIKIEISVLTPLEKVDSADKIILGRHGVMARKGLANGVFLPQVATETGWSKEEFLNRLCVDKAGISASAWKDGSAQLYTFEAEVFSEREG